MRKNREQCLLLVLFYVLLRISNTRETERRERKRGRKQEIHFSLFEVIDPSFPEMFPLYLDCYLN